MSAFVERWQPEINTFHMPFSEMTITLDDIGTILGILVMGRSVSMEPLSFERAKLLVEHGFGVTSQEAHDELAVVWGYPKNSVSKKKISLISVWLGPIWRGIRCGPRRPH